MPESELSRIIFAKDWLLANDMEPDPGTVTISFPKLWMREAREFARGQETVELFVPTRMLTDQNRSKDPTLMLVTFPNRYFQGLEVPDRTPTYIVEKRDESKDDPEIDYKENRTYIHDSGYDDIVGARGTVTPSYHTNPYDEDFTSYHEIEFGGCQDDEDRDWIEIIVDMSDDPKDTKVWFSLWLDGEDEDDYETFCVTPVDVGDDCYWEFYTKDYGEGFEDEYHMFYTYYDDDWKSGCYYDTTPPEHYDYFNGTAELDVKDLPDDDYLVATYDLYIQNFMVEVDDEEYEWESSDYIEDALTYGGSQTASHVYVTRSLDQSGLYFGCQSYD